MAKKVEPLKLTDEQMKALMKQKAEEARLTAGQWIVCYVGAGPEEDEDREGLFVFLDLLGGGLLRHKNHKATGIKDPDGYLIVDPAAAVVVSAAELEDQIEDGLLSRDHVKWHRYGGEDHPTSFGNRTEFQVAVLWAAAGAVEFYLREVTSGSGHDSVKQLTEWQTLPSLTQSRWRDPDKLPSSLVEDPSDE